MTIYSFDNTLAELMANEQTKDILFKAIPQLDGNPMLTQAQKMTFRAITGFMGGLIPQDFLTQVEAQLGEVPYEGKTLVLPEVEQPKAAYFDAALPVEERIEDLVGRMTLEEKLAQLCSDLANSLMGKQPENLSADLHEQYPAGLGRFTQYSIVGMASAKEIAQISNAVQEYFCNHTRLGIPVMLQTENLSGYPGAQGTVFPAMLNAAATFDEALVEKMAQTIGLETRAVGAAHGLSPVLDLARDQRWGRVYETFGEDPYLVSQMGTAYVKGMQQDKKTGTLATGKHFIGYSETQAGLNTAATRLGNRELYDEFAMPFEAAIKAADLASVMTSYSEIDGIPCGANKKIVKGLLRDKIGFDGLVLSDGAAVWKLYDTYHIAESYEEAGLLGIKGGMETEMPVGDSFKKLSSYVENGELDITIIDEAVRHVLKTKFEAGLFENPYADVERLDIVMQTKEAMALSEELARKSVVLLENKENILPLKSGGKLAVIGPHGNFIRPGVSGYTLAAYCEMLRGMTGKNSSEVTFHGMMDEQRKARPGHTANDDINTMLTGNFSVEAMLHSDNHGSTLSDELGKEYTVAAALGCEITGNDTTGFEQAVVAAQKCDTVILTLGGNCGWVGTTGGEGKDRMGLDLPGVQQQLLDAVAATGKDIILILYGPSCYAPKLPNNVKAVLYAWLPGPYGGRALADILTGRFEPVGRLPLTIPRNAGQIPIFHYHKPASGYTSMASLYGEQGSSMATTMNGKNKAEMEVFGGGYTDGLQTPLYPFGYGLGYSDFNIAGLTAQQVQVSTDGVIRLDCEVENLGNRAGSQLVQLYYRDMQAHVTRPVRQLCGYAHVTLEPQKIAQVTFEIDTALLGFTNEDNAFVVEPGTICFMVGASSMDIAEQTMVDLTGPTRNLAGKRKFSSTAKVRVTDE